MASNDIYVADITLVFIFALLTKLITVQPLLMQVLELVPLTQVFPQWSHRRCSAAGLL